MIRKGTRTNGYRSKFEATIADALPKGVGEYEAVRIPYTVIKHATYNPDWVLPKQAIVVEAKGYFPSSDRTKMLMVKEQHPDLDIRILFQNNGKLSKSSRTTYTLWAKKYGFPCAVGKAVPEDWLNHEPSKRQIKAYTEAIQ